MSGGSWNYVYVKFEDVAESLLESDKPERKALGKVIGKIAVAMRDIEWVDSGDKSDGEEILAVKEALGENVDKLILSEVVYKAENIIKELNTYLKEAKNE